MALTASSAVSCPAFIFGNDLKPLPAKARGDLRLFALSGVVSAKRAWIPLPVQIDPMEESPEGPVLALPSASEADALSDLGRVKIGGADRLSLSTEGFGPARRPADGTPCRADTVYEVQDPTAPGRFAYLFACSDQAPIPAAGPVTHVAARDHIETPVYAYDYLPNNQLIFDKLVVRDDGKSYAGGSAADVLLHLDPKNFFTVELTNQNVQSFVEASRLGPVGLVGRIQFYMKVLFFKIDLHMATTASWFVDSANLPMVMDVPVDATDRLNLASGMLFNWLPDDARMLAVSNATTTPVAVPATILKGNSSLADVGLKNCRGDTCFFRSEGRIGAGEGRPFFIDMTVPRSLVAKGFFPSFVGDLAAFRKNVGWDGTDDEPDESDKGRVAMYFETSGLAKGRYKMDYWIRLGNGAGQDGACPASVSVKAATNVDGKTPVAH